MLFSSSYTFTLSWVVGTGLALFAGHDCSAQKPAHLSDELVYTVVECQPEFPGGNSALVDYLQKNVRYPEAARKAKVTGRVFTSFIVERDGRLTDIKLLKGIRADCDEEAIRVIEAMPRWKPGTQSQWPIRVKYNLPIAFGIDYQQPKQAVCILEEISYHEVPTPPQLPLPTANPGTSQFDVFTHDETQPEFPGGTKALMRYLAENTRYPEAARKAGVSGRVFVSFVIDTAGYVSRIQVLKGLGYGCDEEAIRVVAQMPVPWKPGTLSGRAVAVRYNLPVQFGGDQAKSMQPQN